MTFGARLKHLREAAGITQEGLARLANLSTSTVAKMEQRTVDPAWSTVQALAKALGVDCTAFMSDDPPARQVEEQPATAKRRPKK